MKNRTVIVNGVELALVPCEEIPDAYWDTYPRAWGVSSGYIDDYKGELGIFAPGHWPLSGGEGLLARGEKHPGYLGWIPVTFIRPKRSEFGEMSP